MGLSVLFVCTANVCRSPFMELWSRHVVDDPAVDFSSAGTRGLRDEPVAEEMRAPLTRDGVPDRALDDFRSRRLDAAVVEAADLVVTAERSHRSFVLDDHPRLARRVLTLGQAARAAETVPSGVTGSDALIELARRRGAADPDDDVDDPYRRGAEAADACADVVRGMLARVLPVLTAQPLRLP